MDSNHKSAYLYIYPPNCIPAWCPLQGMDAQRVKLDEVLKMSGPEAQPRTDMESAVLSQAIRIVFAALDTVGGRVIPGEDTTETESVQTEPPPSPGTSAAR